MKKVVMSGFSLVDGGGRHLLDLMKEAAAFVRATPEFKPGDVFEFRAPAPDSPQARLAGGLESFTGYFDRVVKDARELGASGNFGCVGTSTEEVDSIFTLFQSQAMADKEKAQKLIDQNERLVARCSTLESEARALNKKLDATIANAAELRTSVETLKTDANVLSVRLAASMRVNEDLRERNAKLLKDHVQTLLEAKKVQPSPIGVDFGVPGGDKPMTWTNDFVREVFGHEKEPKAPLPSLVAQLYGGLTFHQLRLANIARQKDFTSSQDWTVADWMVALTGEVGELANLIKKVRRGWPQDQQNIRKRMASELGDIQTYLDKLATALGFNLGACTREKFNEVSTKIGSGARL